MHYFKINFRLILVCYLQKVVLLTCLPVNKMDAIHKGCMTIDAEKFSNFNRLMNGSERQNILKVMTQKHKHFFTWVSILKHLEIHAGLF